MRISLRSLILIVVLCGMGTSVVQMDRQRNRLKRERDVVIEINEDLTDDHERMKALYDARQSEVKRLRDANGKAEADAERAERQARQMRAQLDTEQQRAELRLKQAVRTEAKAYQRELAYFQDHNNLLKKELAALKAENAKVEQ